MGHFLAVSAFRTEDFRRVLDAVMHYFTTYDVSLRTVPDRRPHPATVDLFEPTDGWTVALWPEYFGPWARPLCQWLSRQVGTLASAMSIHDSDTWLHSLYLDGEEIDRFARAPHGIAGARTGVRELSVQWAGNPEVVAGAFGVPVPEVTPFYSHVQDCNEWEFVGLWDQLGVPYPTHATRTLPVWASLVPQPTWQSRLPSAD